MEVSLDNLQRALKSAAPAQETTIKLVKKNGHPYLQFLIIVQAGQQINIAHDVPIQLLSAQQLAQYVEPHLPDPEVREHLSAGPYHDAPSAAFADCH